jgi:hypothetical protein
MPVSAGVVYVDIAPQVAKTFGSDIEKQVTGPVEDSGNRVGNSLTKVAGLIGGAFAAKGIFDFGKSAIEAATESNKITAQTEAVIKSTGGAAQVTAGQISDLATSISNKTGVDDEAIQSASNLLLTFTNLKNGVGKSNDVFNQATKTAVDMGAALGGDAASNAVMLGKALNDPIAGVGALSRVGVTFTDQQKEQIKTMVKAGDTMGAQKVILGELNKEFGGSAEAQATAGDKLKVTWGNLQEQIGNKLLPIFEKVAGWLADFLPKAFDAVSTAIDKAKPFIEGITKAFGEGGLGGVIGFLKDKFVEAWPAIQTALGNILSGIGSWINDKAIPYLREQFPAWISALWEWIKDVIPPALQALGEFLGKVGGWIISDGIPKLVDWAGQMTVKLWEWIQDAAPPALEKLGEFLGKIGSWIVTDGIPKAIEFLAKMAVKFVDWITDLLPQLPPKLGEFLGKIAAWVVTDGIPKLIEIAGKLSEKLLSFLVDAAQAAPGKISEFIGAIVRWLRDEGPRVLGEAMGKLADAITAPFKGAFNMIAKFWNDTVGKVSFSVPDWVPLIGGKGWKFPTIPILHQGGIVPGPPGAEILGLLKAGEGVLPRGLMSSLRDFDLSTDGLRGSTFNQHVEVHGANLSAADVATELGWLMRTSGR